MFEDSYNSSEVTISHGPWEMMVTKEYRSLPLVNLSYCSLILKHRPSHPLGAGAPVTGWSALLPRGTLDFEEPGSVVYHSRLILILSTERTHFLICELFESLKACLRNKTFHFKNSKPLFINNISTSDVNTVFFLFSCNYETRSNLEHEAKTSHQILTPSS